jgi:hypothetical protein
MKKRADTATKTRRKRDATMKKVGYFLTMRHRIGRHEKQKRISPPPLITAAHAS